jgi:hypothetical protein
MICFSFFNSWIRYVHASYLYCHLLIPPLITLIGWLLYVSSSIGGLVRSVCYLFLFNFVVRIVARIDGTMSPPTPHSTLAAPPLKHTSCHEHRLLVGFCCCFFLVSFGHVRPSRGTISSLFFDMCCFAPSKQANQRWRHQTRPQAPRIGPWEAAAPCVVGAADLPME